MSHAAKLRPLPFHDHLRDALRDLEPGLWRWFSSEKFGKKHADDVRLELLRSTYRMPRDVHGSLYALADEIASAFGIAAPVTIYQAQEDGAMNAALVFAPDEVHIVLRGPIEKKLTETERRALFGHELAHHKLWTAEGGEYRVTGALVEHVATSGGAPSHVQSALRYRLWTELYADRAGLIACDDLPAAISCLVKVGTGLDHVDGAAYLAQAEEAISAAVTKSEGRTHPEAFIRAFALKSWVTGGDFSDVRRLVEGPVEIDALDLLQQRELTRTTRRLVEQILAPAWLRTDATLAHARRFFPDYAPASAEPAEGPPLDLRDATESVAEYAAYILLDFGLVDREVEEVSLAHVARLSADLGIREAFRKLAKKELKLTASALAELEREGVRLETEPPPPVVAGSMQDAT